MTKRQTFGDRMAYVYVLADPVTSRVFYVGKGTGKRAWLHEKNVRGEREKNHLKSAEIERIIQSGRRPKVRIVKRGLTNAEAYKIERGLIVRNHKRLTNISLGERSEMERGQAEARAMMLRFKPLCVIFHEPKWEMKRFPVWCQSLSQLAGLSRTPLDWDDHPRSHPMLRNGFARLSQPRIAASASS